MTKKYSGESTSCNVLVNVFQLDLEPNHGTDENRVEHHVIKYPAKISMEYRITMDEKLNVVITNSLQNAFLTLEQYAFIEDGIFVAPKQECKFEGDYNALSNLVFDLKIPVSDIQVIISEITGTGYTFTSEEAFLLEYYGTHPIHYRHDFSPITKKGTELCSKINAAIVLCQKDVDTVVENHYRQAKETCLDSD